MFKGLNELRLNEATVMAAVEEYLNQRISNTSDEVEVTTVRETAVTSPRSFTVFVKPKAGNE